MTQDPENTKTLLAGTMGQVAFTCGYDMLRADDPGCQYMARFQEALPVEQNIVMNNRF